MKLRENIESKLSKQSLTSPESITDNLKEEILEILKSAQGAPINADTSPFVIMVAGVNGVGKTTTIGKLSNRLQTDDKNHPAVSSANDYPFLLSDEKVQKISLNPEELLKKAESDEKTAKPPKTE